MTDRLRALVDTMLPGGEGFPSASAANVPEWLPGHSRFGPVVAGFLDALPGEFEHMSSSERTDVLSALEADDPQRFNEVVIAVYSAYYNRPGVLRAIESACGYKAVPPQPGGYELPPFDESILAVPKSRPPSWCDPGEEGGSP